jgi:hypothetical protein
MREANGEPGTGNREFRTGKRKAHRIDPFSIPGSRFSIAFSAHALRSCAATLRVQSDRREVFALIADG